MLGKQENRRASGGWADPGPHGEHSQTQKGSVRETKRGGEAQKKAGLEDIKKLAEAGLGGAYL